MARHASNERDSFVLVQGQHCQAESSTFDACPKKKAAELPPLSETLVEPDADDPKATILELDELWSFVMKKVNKSWIWIALCRKTKQVVARAVGDRSEKTCRELWNNIPEAYRKAHCYSDFWAAYQSVIPEEQHTAVRKETGETAHI